MSYSILEAVRRALVFDSGVESIIKDRIYPRDSKFVERMEEGQFPLVVFSMLDEDVDPCGRIKGTVQLEVVTRGNVKKPLWDIHRAIELAATPRLIQDRTTDATDLKIRVALFRLAGVEDNVFDVDTDTWRLRSQWNTKYVRKP